MGRYGIPEGGEGDEALERDFQCVGNSDNTCTGCGMCEVGDGDEVRDVRGRAATVLVTLNPDRPDVAGGASGKVASNRPGFSSVSTDQDFHPAAPWMRGFRD